MAKFWMKNGIILGDETGAPLLCPYCPCLPDYLIGTSCGNPYQTYRFQKTWAYLNEEFELVEVTLPYQMNYVGTEGAITTAAAVWQSDLFTPPGWGTINVMWFWELAFFCPDKSFTLWAVLKNIVTNEIINTYDMWLSDNDLETLTTVQVTNNTNETLTLYGTEPDNYYGPPSGWNTGWSLGFGTGGA